MQEEAQGQLGALDYPPGSLVFPLPVLRVLCGRALLKLLLRGGGLALQSDRDAACLLEGALLSTLVGNGSGARAGAVVAASALVALALVPGLGLRVRDGGSTFVPEPAISSP